MRDLRDFNELKRPDFLCSDLSIVANGGVWAVSVWGTNILLKRMCDGDTVYGVGMPVGGLQQAGEVYVPLWQMFSSRKLKI